MQHVKKHNPPRPLFTHALIHYLKGEELALSSRVTPVADAGLVGDSGSDGPTRHRADIDSIDLALEVSVENLTESLCWQRLGGISKLQLKSAIRIHTNPQTGQIAANILWNFLSKMSKAFKVDSERHQGVASEGQHRKKVVQRRF